LLPQVTAPSTITTDGITFTLEPGGFVTSSPPVPSSVFLDGSLLSVGSASQTITEPDGLVVTIGPSGIAVGPDTFQFPFPCVTTTIDRLTLGVPCTVISSSAVSTSSPPSSTGALPIFTAWPADLSISFDTTAPVSTGMSYLDCFRRSGE
jgi:hypothetical protein